MEGIEKKVNKALTIQYGTGHFNLMDPSEEEQYLRFWNSEKKFSFVFKMDVDIDTRAQLVCDVLENLYILRDVYDKYIYTKNKQTVREAIKLLENDLEIELATVEKAIEKQEAKIVEGKQHLEILQQHRASVCEEIAEQQAKEAEEEAADGHTCNP